MPSSIITHTYFINENITLPVISISTDPENLWNDEIGIYCIGTNGITGYGVTANYWQNWERPINIELYEPNGNIAFNINAGISIGGMRRNMKQKSFRIFARNKYGTAEINYKIFDDKPINKFKSIILRNGGLPDFTSTIFRDGMMQSLLIGQMDIDYQAYKPSVVFLNGEFWGIYNIREKLNEDYLASNHGVNPDNVDLLECNAHVIEGDALHYNTMLNFIISNDMTLPTNYNYIKSQMDVDEYLNYQISQIYFANYDWPGLNIKFWRPKAENVKWRWLLFDTDAGFGMWGQYYYNEIEHATAIDGPGWPNPPWSTLLFRKLLENNEFKNEFIQRLASYLNTTFEPERVIHIIDSLKINIHPDMPRHITRWKDEDSSDGVCVASVSEWESEVDVLREFANLRPAYVRQHIINKFGLSGTVELIVNTIGEGKVKINNVNIPDSSFTGIYFKDFPIHLKAIPKVGYKFVNWQGISNDDTSEISFILTQNSTITAIFDYTDESIIPSEVSTNMILTQSESPYIALGDIVVDSNVTLQIEPGVEILMPDSANIIVYGELIMNGTENNPIYIKPNLTVGTYKWGAICIHNATDTTKLSYVRIEGASYGRDKITFKAAVSGFNSDIILDNVFIKDTNQPFYSQYGDIMIKNSTFRSTQICDLINIKYANSALVENCDLRGNDAYDTDAIDYDGINNGIIRGNNIYGFFGLNSDGIDIGEGAANILIENNLIYNCSDKGVSVGQASSAILKRNVIVNCYQGVGVKDSLSYARIDQNTFYGNGTAIACFEKIFGNGGGSADVVNTILSNSYESSYFVDEFSSINITYSLSNTNNLPGEGNILAVPLFVNANIYNLELLPNSPCINSGDPASPLDPDGTLADMGAYYIYNTPDEVSIIINEINYNSPIEYDSEDWVEFYNKGETTVDMSGWVFKDQNNDHIFHFQEPPVRIGCTAEVPIGLACLNGIPTMAIGKGDVII